MAVGAGELSPDAVLFTGDLVQGGGYQPGWDEFFRHTAGASGDLLTDVPIIPAFGKWESYGAINGGYGTPEDRTPVVRSRAKFHAYFDAPGNGTPEHRDNYHRVDYGPVTVLTLDSNNGEPDDSAANYPPEEKLTGREYTGPGRRRHGCALLRRGCLGRRPAGRAPGRPHARQPAAGVQRLQPVDGGPGRARGVGRRRRDAAAALGRKALRSSRDRRQPGAGEERRKARITLTPVHVFPVMDDKLTVLRTERRTYSDRVVIDVAADGTPAR
ncbi:hypothetical protein [Nonomuraea diastatica]|uniref:Calcineurin-like phosphoesterase domain-containing protein n=1 Tax=Nonomuraea diastatica TaxID=1848329 RepID=A0A4R4WER6_9ACTN|nr:hypothetical protein [Nonomuraea diastatica]TDD17429.1 hypothetical protein E1294_27710 [Nonomuraea diastatica]